MNELKYTDKRIGTIVNKIGLDENVALYCVNKHKKYAIWIANQIKDYSLDIHNNEGLDRILEWKLNVQGVNLKEFNYQTALEEANKYFNSLFVKTPKSLKNKNVVLDCDKYKWVQLKTKDDCIEEGDAMSHCIGDSSHASNIHHGLSVAFSLRDKYNKPHLTLEARINPDGSIGNIFEFKGVSNQVPKSEYVECFIELLKKYKFKSATDNTFRTALIRDINVATKINNIDSEFLSFDIKLSLGINPFDENSIIIREIYSHNQTEKSETVISKGVKLYSRVRILAKKIIIEDNVLFGGDVELQSNNIIIGENVKIAGSLKISKEFKTKKIKLETKSNLIVFGDVTSCKKFKLNCEGNFNLKL